MQLTMQKATRVLTLMVLIILVLIGLLLLQITRTMHGRGKGSQELVWELPTSDHAMPPEWDEGSSEFHGKEYARAARSFASGAALYPSEVLFFQAAAISFSAASQADSALVYLNGSERLAVFPVKLQPLRRHILLEGGFALADGNDPNGALDVARRILSGWPDDSDGMLLQGYGEARLGHAVAAEDLLGRLVGAHPRQVAAYKTLVQLCLQRGDADAARRWVEQLAKTDPQASGLDALRQMVENGAAAGPQVASERLRVSCPSGCSDDVPRRVLDEAEQAWSYLDGELGLQSPRQVSILVVPGKGGGPELPAWADAIYDGQIRVPLDHLDNGLQPILRHELTHAFFAEASKGRVPLWYNEGMAQRMQGLTLDNLPDAAGMSWLDSLPQRRNFLDLDEARARLAYRYSLRLACELWQQRGSAAMRDYLADLADGVPDSSAFRDAFGSSYAALSARIRAGL